ncbi:MAG: hypothetical protein ACKVOP_11825 [Sphingomonadaceae bacterium]
MIDNLSLGLSHGLLLLAAWRLLMRPDLDDETATTKPKSFWSRRRPDAPDA